MHETIESRSRDRERLLGVARQFGAGLAERLPVRRVAVVGSVARGDFNVWSDIDVLVVVDELPDSPRARLALLDADAPAGIQPVGWTPGELASERSRGNPLARELDTDGVEVP